jgi:hypothetical protein
MLKKFLLDSKEKNKLEILDNWSILKEKYKNIFKFSIAIMKLNFWVCIGLSRWKYLYTKRYMQNSRSMDISHDYTDVGSQIPFLGSEPIFAFLPAKSIYFLHIYKISDRLMSHMTYFIFEPPSVQPRDPADSKFFLG